MKRDLKQDMNQHARYSIKTSRMEHELKEEVFEEPLWSGSKFQEVPNFGEIMKIMLEAIWIKNANNIPVQERNNFRIIINELQDFAHKLT